MSWDTAAWLSVRDGDVHMIELANYLDVQRALQEDTAEILRQIPVAAVQLSLPLDGSGARICASVRSDERARVPSHVDVELDGRRVKIPVVTAPDYEEYEAY
jgi:hypothetical protein